jgi:hypothetical protein
MHRTVYHWACCLGFYFACMGVSLADSVDYVRDIKPLLTSRCLSCHGALQQQAGLRLDTGLLIRQGADSGTVIVPGQPSASGLLDRVATTDAAQRMPPEGEPLSEAQIGLLRQWIADGAISPEGEVPEKDPSLHWSFQIPVRSAIPSAEGQPAPQHPVDAFLMEKLAEQGLQPRPWASKPMLLRRVTLDLIGLPPTREELQAFLADDSEEAYAKVVDRLLNDPRHGERWARHWMDIWRYSDWYGRRDANDVRNSASQIYRWRDWIVKSLNEGRGYDRMVQEMLAADEIRPDDYEAGVATGFLIRNYYSLNANDWMRSAVEHSGKAFLGLTFNCAHCHDHKYDPITHENYFQMRAFFEPIYIRQDRVPGEADPGVFQDYSYSGVRSVQRLGAVRVFDKSPDATTWFYTGGDERNRVAEKGSLKPGLPAFLEHALSPVEPVSLPPRAWYPGLRPEIQQTLVADAASAIQKAQAELEAVLEVTPELPEDVKIQLADAESNFAKVVNEAMMANKPGAISGQQSLLFDAGSGRSLIQNRLKTLSALEHGAAFEFQLLILNDTHINFQFARDIANGLTAGYLAFDNGRIMAYQPGSFTEFQTGHYEVASGQTLFHVRLVLNVNDDHSLLSVSSINDGKLLVDQVPIALNGWRPAGDDNQGLSFDARPGSLAVVDDLTLLAPGVASSSGQRLLFWDFEPTVCRDETSPIGSEGWEGSPYAVAPGTAIVSSTAANKELQLAKHQLKLAQAAARRPQLAIHAAETRLRAVTAELAGLEARMAAARAQYENGPTGDLAAEDVSRLIRTASRLEREAALQKAESDVLASELAHTKAEAKPADDATRASEMAAAAKAMNDAAAAVTTAKAALVDETRAETYSPLSPVYPRESTGRRRALAYAITSSENPLTARVAVNHIWGRHFHSPLVADVYDFGRNGNEPTHPQLLDWLAVEFMESGWNMKHLHRLLVTSDAYQRVSSVGDATANVTKDPENRFLWRMNSGRMESEVVRDSLLFVAGQLDLTMGGVERENNESLTTRRRSLYYSVYPEAGGKSALGELFDGPDPLDCYRRASSIVPQQALALTNSDLVHQMSTAIVASWSSRNSLTDDAGPADRQFVTEIFQQILTRSPTDAEMNVCLAALQQQTSTAPAANPADQRRQGYESIVRILLNHNDFLTTR